MWDTHRHCGRQVEELSLHSEGLLTIRHFVAKKELMHTFTILRNAGTSSVDAQSFQALNQDLSGFIDEEVDLLALGQTLGGVNQQFLALDHLSLHPGVGLRRIGCTNVDELLQATGYHCGFMGDDAVRYGLAPLGIVTSLPGLQKYGPAFDKHCRDGTTSAHLHVVPDGERFHEAVLLSDPAGDGGPVFKVSRFEQLFLGSGHTRKMLSQGLNSTQLAPVSLMLSNGDALLAYAYKIQTN